LPQNVYVSFDVDGLDPKLCPNTGTPVPGGLELEQAIYLVKQLVEQGKTIIGFDVNEVAPGDDEWDANVGARLVYRLANLAALSRGLEPVV
jgi:agmatinase